MKLKYEWSGFYANFRSLESISYQDFKLLTTRGNFNKNKLKFHKACEHFPNNPES